MSGMGAAPQFHIGEERLMTGAARCGLAAPSRHDLLGRVTADFGAKARQAEERIDGIRDGRVGEEQHLMRFHSASPIARSRTTTVSTGFSCGSVTWKKIETGPAPSTFAAS